MLQAKSNIYTIIDNKKNPEKVLKKPKHAALTIQYVYAIDRHK